MAADLREVFVRDYRVVYQIVGDEVVILTIHHGTRPLWDLSDPDERQLADASGDRREGEGASGAAHGSSEEERGDLVTREQML